MSCEASLWDEPLRAVGQSSVNGMASPPIRVAHSFIHFFTEQEWGSLWGLKVGRWEGAPSREGHPGRMDPDGPLIGVPQMSPEKPHFPKVLSWKTDFFFFFFEEKNSVVK